MLIALYSPKNTHDARFLANYAYIMSVAAENGAILAGKKGPVVRLRHGCRQRH
jgi:hypothetical protein